MAYTMEVLLSVLHPHGPVKFDALSKNRRRVEHGLTTVGRPKGSVNKLKDAIIISIGVSGRVLLEPIRHGALAIDPQLRRIPQEIRDGRDAALEECCPLIRLMELLSSLST